MSDPNDSTRTLLAAAIGLAIGAGGMLIGQQLTSKPEDAPPDSAARIAELETRLQRSLDDSSRLKADLDKARSDLDEALAGGQDVALRGPDAVADPPDPDAAARGGILEALVELGADETARGVDAQVAELAERLNLSEAQQQEVKAALLARAKAQQQAGLRMISGKATIEDLLAADPDNHSAVDAAMEGILSASQLEEYQAYAEEREVKRIERKSDEELGGLRSVAELTDQQAEEAWQVFADIQAGETPGSVPEGTTLEDFGGIIDGAIDKRIAGLTPILDARQMQAYKGQTETFRNFFTTIIKAGTAGGE